MVYILKGNPMKQAIAALLVLSALRPAFAAQDDQVEPVEMPIEAYWKEGLRFRTKDGSFEGRVGGRAILHYRSLWDRPDDDTAPFRSVPDSFFARQIRFETEGTVYKEFGYKVQTEFSTGNFNQPAGTGPSNVTGTLRDAWVEWRRWKELYVRIGQFYEPISQEDFTSTRFIDFAERSPMNRLAPGRETGLEIYGTLLDNHFTYFLMVSNGGAVLNDQGRTVADRDDEKELAGVVWFRPFTSTDGFLRRLRVGVGGSVGDVDMVDGAGFDLISTELSILYLNAPAAAPDFDGRRVRIVPQLSWPMGPFSLSAEYLWREDELASGAPEDDLESRGWYLYGTLLLTGEEKNPEQRVVPLGEWGAVELTLRASRVEIRNAFEAGISTPGGNSEEMMSVTAGVNWWVRRFFRLTLNVVREDYQDDLDFDNSTEEWLWGVIFRAQVDF